MDTCTKSPDTLNGFVHAAEGSGLVWSGSLEAGLHEIAYRFSAPRFAVDSLYFDWMEHPTGPWDYAPPFAPNRGQCLLPHVTLAVMPGNISTRARVFIPRRQELDAKIFTGRIGFYLDSRREVSLRLSCDLADVDWQNCELTRFDDFLADYRQDDFLTGQRFWHAPGTPDALARTWGRSPWSRRLDEILDDCAAAQIAPPRTPEEASRISTTLKTRQPYEDSVVFPGNYLAALSLRLLVRPRPEDAEQLLRWVDGLVALPYWGFTADPIGADHNNDLTADFNMFGLALALNWHEARLGPERTARVIGKIAHQAEEMLRWIVHARSSWPGTVSQNHTFFGHQTLLLAGLALLGRHDRALHWLNVALPAFRRFADALPPDGSFHEGIGYISFGLLGLMPALYLIQQYTGKNSVPDAWLEKHWDVAAKLLPDDPTEGFFVDDSNGALPFWYPLLVRAFAHAPKGTPTRARAQHLLARFHHYNRSQQAHHQLNANFWTCLWAPALASADFEPPALPRSPCDYLEDCGYVIFNLDEQTKAYFLTGPAHGYALFGKERHTYAYGHHHPDAGNLLIHHAGKWFLADSGYTWCKLSAEHNVLLVDGRGQHNDGHVWMTPPPFDFTPPRVRITSLSGGAVRAEIDLACYYPRSLGLRQWRRVIIGVPRKGLAISDDVRLSDGSEARLAASWGSDYAWQKDAEGAYGIADGGHCRFALHGADQSVSVGTILPAQKYVDTVKAARPWHALRVGTIGPVNRHRFHAVFRLPGIDAAFDRELLSTLTET